ncbi:hypothetical protein AVEN_36108-1 [Araneus ventricosus]|uniref:HAT C-terminal dimerisation domain-containing protein n=1 Tax=Araneus ventricosus TaxID=182803 RepID=A0A4Y2TLL5_ARAVE|nr:hypothetical protein AVEN_36108-1 [Araneus ventricosus]
MGCCPRWRGHSGVKEIAAKLGIKEEIPRVCRLQTARNNVPDSTEEEYYRRAVYVPYLDDFCNSLKERFESHKETVASLQHILPEFCTKANFYSLEAAFNFYEEYLSHKEVVQSEFMSWKEKWSQKKSENLPKTAISSLEKCDKTFLPNIYILLKLLAVVPVSVATVERSFSSLKRLKTYLRNTTSKNDDDSAHLQRKILKDLRKLDCSENVDEEAVEKWINEHSTLECGKVLSDDDIVSRATYGSEETRNFEECSGSDEENLVTHQKLSQGDTLVHTEVLHNYLEKEDESTPAEKIIWRNLRSIIYRRVNEKQKQTSIISFFTKQ